MQTKFIQIVHYIYKFDLQGNFHHWGDGVMVTETFWFDPNMHRTKYISKKTQTLSTNLIAEQLDSNLWKNKQPDASLLKNCTVAKIDADPFVYMKWYAVPCDQTFFATFMCFVPRTISDDVTDRVANSELACEPGWFHWIFFTECYAVKTLPVIVNFTAVKQFCSLSNSSLLNLHEISRSVATIEEEKHIMQLWYQQLRPSVRQHAHYLDNIVSRMIVEKKSLLSLFEILKLYIHNNIRALVTINDRCAVAEHSTRSISGTLQWTAEYCNQVIIADIFVCHKPSPLTEIFLCKTDYYQCADKTCILALYVCDSVNDCLDEDDESHCDTVLRQEEGFSFQNSSLYLPCLMYHNCSYTAVSLVPPVKLHTICDGLKSDSITLNEDEMCIKRHFKHINPYQMISKSPWERQPSATFSDIFYNLIEMVQTEKMEIKDKTNITNQSVISGKDYEVKCENSGFTRLSDICKVSQCELSARSGICYWMGCPGMFRCYGTSYCLQLSLVCDGQKDCTFGDDEVSCSRGHCPGLLKCHGEVRCVSPEQICDGYTDCILSFDDEILCNNCPTDHCICDGYLSHCIVNNTLNAITNIDKLYIKGVILKGTQNSLSLNIFYTLSIVFLDLSNCSIIDITFSSNSKSVHQKIFFGNFSANKISNTIFLRAEILNELIVVDLSNNYISVLDLTGVTLVHLLAIYVENNPIMEIAIDRKMNDLNYVNLLHVKFRWGITVTLTSIQKYIEVTDSFLCCLMPQEMTCIIHGEDIQQCYGLMNDMPSRISFLILTILASMLVIIVSLRASYQIKTKVRKYFNISKLNHLIAALLCMLSLLVLSVLGMLEINLIRWRQSLGCHVLNAIMSVTIGTNMAFKTFAVTIVAFKIIYPFAHQCQWLKKTYFIGILIWLCNIVSYSVSKVLASLQTADLPFDKFCSIGECHVQGIQKRLVYIFICLFDFVSIIIIISILIWTSVVLVRKNKSIIVKGKLPVAKIMLKLARQMIPQVVFAFCLCSISLLQITTQSLKENYCYAVFSYVFPGVAIFDAILSILM